MGGMSPHLIEQGRLTVPAFLQQQGYLRVCIYGALHRTDEMPKLERLPAMLPVVQDRIAVLPENRSRLIESVETALKFGKGKVTFIEPDAAASQSAMPFSTGWHCAHCDLDIRAPSRLRTHHRARS